MVTEFLQLNHDSSVVIFCNSRKQLQHFSFHLDKRLDQAKITIDIFNINGSLNKIDKFWRICLFCDDLHSRQGQFRALVTTNAINVGIDKHSIALQVWFEWPRDLLTYFQERGREFWSQGVRSTCIVFGDFGSFIYLMSQLLILSN
jgi:superfamily II DNA helicase RecQ